MVHIPFLNIEVPEPRLANLVPDLVTLILRMCTRAVDAALHATHPLPPDIERLYTQEVIESFPREIQRVLQRACEGKHRDEDHVSEEVEDATLDYYRRMMRTAAVGETDEDQEDVTAYKLGLDRPSAQDLVWDDYLRRHEGLLLPPEEALGVEGTQAEREAIAIAMQASVQEAHEEAMTPLRHAERRGTLASQVRSGRQQTAGTAVRAGASLALGIGLVRGIALLVRRLQALRKPKKGKKAGKAVAPPPRRPTPMQQAAAAPSAQPQQQQQQATASTAQAKAQEQQAAAVKARPRTTTRKR